MKMDRRRQEIVSQKLASCKGNQYCEYLVCKDWALPIDYNVTDHGV